MDRMSFFKKLLGLKSSSSSSTRGHKLGNGEENEMDSLLSPESFEYDVVFSDTLLGIQIAKGSDEGSYVLSVDSSSSNSRDILKSDKIVYLNGALVLSHEDLIANLKCLPRPITITFAIFSNLDVL